MQGGTVLDAPPYALRATPPAARAFVNPPLAAGFFATLLLSAPFALYAEPRPVDAVVRHWTVVTVEDPTAEADQEAGIRRVLGSTVIEVPGGAPDAEAVPEALASAARFLKRWAGDPLITPAVAPHSAYLCSPETLKSVKALADRYD